MTMGRTLEDNVYARIEWHLHNVPELKARVSALVDDTCNLSGMGSEAGSSRVISKISDQTAMNAIRLADDPARKWLDVIAATYAYFDQETSEGIMARLFYGKRVTTDHVSKQMDCAWKTVKAYRDNFVVRCAMYAAERGLIKLQHTKGGEAV